VEGLDVVVLEEVSGGATGVGALVVSFVDHPGLSSGREASSGAGVDRLALRVVHQQRDERFGEHLGDGVVGEGCAVGEGVAVFADVHDHLGLHGPTTAGDQVGGGIRALLGE
jgi:hypothetical protein